MKISEEFQPVRGYKTVYGSISGNYAFRGEKTIWFESTLERDFLKKQEFNDAVLDVVSQPVEIPYTTSTGKKTTYTPDFLVQFSSHGFFHPECVPKPILAEIKPNKKLKTDWHKLKNKFKAGVSYAKEQGWVFHIYDENKICDQYLANIEFLRRFHRAEYEQNESELLIEMLRALGQCRINELPAHLYKSETNHLMGIHHVWHLISKKYIACDLTQKLSNETVIWVNDNRAIFTGEV